MPDIHMTHIFDNVAYLAKKYVCVLYNIYIYIHVYMEKNKCCVRINQQITTHLDIHTITYYNRSIWNEGRLCTGTIFIGWDPPEAPTLVAKHSGGERIAPKATTGRRPFGG